MAVWSSISPLPKLPVKPTHDEVATYLPPPPSFHLLILRRKSPSLCCHGLSRRSRAIRPTSSPHRSTKRCTQSASNLLCFVNLFVPDPNLAASASSCATIPFPPAIFPSSTLKSSNAFNGSFKGFRSSSGGDGRRTLRMAPVFGSRWMRTVAGINTFDACVCAASESASRVEVELCAEGATGSVPPARAFSLEVRPRRW